MQVKSCFALNGCIATSESIFYTGPAFYNCNLGIYVYNAVLIQPNSDFICLKMLSHLSTC